ncbi:MAG: FHA domain-containing protein [Verrucomicrobia bacterium]|nr:FHA domain-containing protein [Verrucomicrobiota bacterium]
MPSTAKVTLQVENPDGTFNAFELTEHDTFLLGRMADCHLCLPDDSQVSRHHFLLETCPPQASLRDLGSMNGTHVNGKKCGGREKGETPEQGAQRQYPNVDLKHGDRITVGKSTIQDDLTGKFPYRFDPKRDPIDIILNETPVPIRDRMPGLTKDLAAVIDQALVRSPKDRFPDAGKLLAGIRNPSF